ncbi:LAGLIDADG family homing endonuclease [Patescibacteria group bacterium]|nr:LAGLIDADG family homing endonuclease [Patescibacteria group bacterium]
MFLCYNSGMIKCKLCGRYFKFITEKHLQSKHDCSVKEYAEQFGDKGVGFFPIISQKLDKNDPRYIKWRKSLKNRPSPWNKGLNKNTHLSIAKISKTFKKNKIDNFKQWRQKEIEAGRIKTDYPPFEKTGDLAELIGVILGDGHIGKFPRTEVLEIYSNSNNPGFVNRYTTLVEQTFNKKPKVSKRKTSNCINIVIYQKNISKRLGIPAGARGDKCFHIPRWICNNKEYLIRYLRGLFEAEGSFNVHLPTYTYKFIFANRNESLLKNVFRALRILGFNPHKTYKNIQISRKEEVYRCKDLISFRQY